MGLLRASFFATGQFVLLWGISLLAFDQLVLFKTKDADRKEGLRGMLAQAKTVAAEKRDVIDPPDWAAFSLMSVGSVTMLYAIALPKKHH